MECQKCKKSKDLQSITLDGISRSIRYSKKLLTFSGYLFALFNHYPHKMYWI